LNNKLTSRIFSHHRKLESLLSPHAINSKNTKGRSYDEKIKNNIRNIFQIDKDRIIHTNSFRRLKHKSQVFIAPQGDHFVTRLTHTIEVAQISRTISRALRLNEDLTEAIALGHDLGHSPFGHVGETALNQISQDGFHHSRQSVRIIEKLEKNGKGLNLNFEVIEGIKRHSKPQGEFFNKELVKGLSLEGQIVRISDFIAYVTSDINDAIRAGLLNIDEIPKYVTQEVGEKHSDRVNTLVLNIIENSFDCSFDDNNNDPWIRMSDDLIEIVTELRNFMFKNVYLPVSNSSAATSSMRIIEILFDHLMNNSELIPDYLLEASGGNLEKSVIDFITGMTDDFALRFAETLDPSLASDVFEGRL
jgi:dGTPase